MRVASLRAARDSRDYLDGGSAIINRVDQLWPPIGRLCATLREHPHAFAVLYPTPRSFRVGARATDDQDVFILQLAGRKAGRVRLTQPLPYTHEMLGRAHPAAAVGELPASPCPLSSGRALAPLPRGAVHVARATDACGSLHVTLTVKL